MKKEQIFTRIILPIIIILPLPLWLVTYYCFDTNENWKFLFKLISCVFSGTFLLMIIYLLFWSFWESGSGKLILALILLLISIALLILTVYTYQKKGVVLYYGGYGFAFCLILSVVTLSEALKK